MFGLAELKKDEKSNPQPLEADEHHKEPLQIQILEKMSQLMTAAFGFIAAFAWNQAMIKVINEIWGEDPSVYVRLGYAVLVTIVAVIAGLWIANTTHKVKAALGHGHPPMTA